MDIQLDLVQSSALAMLLLAGGEYARRRIGFLHRFCIPAPVVGGFMFALLVLVLRQTNVAQIQLDTTLQTPAMVAFFTTIGLAGSLAMIKKGGKLLLMYLIACWSLAIMQNVIGMTMAKVVGVDPMLGIMAGAVALEGGHGNAAAFGPTAEAMGFEGATTVAIAAATFGLVAGSMLGGMSANYLVARHNIEIPKKAGMIGKIATAGAVIKEMAVGDSTKGSVATITRSEEDTAENPSANYGSLLTVVVLLATLMVLGTVLGDWLSGLTGLTLPAYVGAMIVAVIFRNVNDKFGWFKINDAAVDLIAKFALGFFLTLAMMSLKMWELATLAGPLVIILIVQLAFILIFAVVVVFRMLGKNYDAATMVAGFIGHGLGAAPNALANMDAFNAKFGVRSERAFLIVPLAGAVLVDLVALPWIVWCMNLVS